MLLKKEEFWTRIEKGKTDSLYLLYGQEEFLIREAGSKIEYSFLGPEADKFQRHHLYGDEVSIDELIQLASTIPFGKSKRVITYQLTGRLKADDKDLILRYAGRPAKDTILILTAVEMDARTAFFKQLKEKAIVIRFYPLFKNQIPDWIKKHVAKTGIQISHNAAQLLEELIGSDLSLLSNEIQKMALYLQPRKKIDLKDVEEVVGKARIFSIFELTNSLGEKRVGQSFQILRQILDAGQLPVGIIALIANHFRRLLTVKELNSHGKQQGEIARSIGIPPTFLKEYLQQSKLFSPDEIRTIFGCLLEADLQLKSSPLSQDIILESVIFKICSPNSI
jgi:DNA polymerase-3 subunit delta